VGVALVYGSCAKFEVLFNISVMAEASEFKFDIELRFVKFNYKITPNDKSGRGFRLGSFRNLGFLLISMQWLKIAISSLVHSFGLLVRPIIKSHK